MELIQYCYADTRGLYYKPMAIANDDSRVIHKLEASLTDDTIFVIYYHHMFIVQATGMRKTLSWVESVFSMIKPSVIYALSVANESHYAECRYAECRYRECTCASIQFRGLYY
jgi:hypothetical protein